MASQSYIVVDPEKSKLPIEMPIEMQDLGEEIRSQMKEKGYYSEYSVFAKNLVKFADKKGTAESMLESDPHFNILRLNTKDFDLSFPFEGLASITDENLLGYAPGGSYEDGKWTGIAIFFKHESLGVCRLSVFDMPSITGQAVYDSRFVSYEINDKPTTSSAKGNLESGFVYEASWTGSRYEKMMGCSDGKPFDRAMLARLITFAKVIDKDLPDTP
jgi:hypothetical protein